MRLYHRTNYSFLQSIILFLLFLALYSCSSPVSTQQLLTVKVTADSVANQIKVPSGSTVQQVLDNAQIILNELDRVQPPLSTIITDGSEVIVTRIIEDTYTQQVIVPFTYQEYKNEALPEGEKRLSQVGVNGLQEVTYQRVFENGIEVSNTLVETTIIKEPIPEVVMVGSQPISNAIYLPGKLAYLSAGNAWLIENTTANRKLIVSTGDLDGRVFSLSENGKYLLFTRFSDDENVVNKLWMASLSEDPVKILDLGVENIVHYAEFNSDATRIAYSTAEWRETPPGWQANNDLYILGLPNTGTSNILSTIMEANTGGVYGWWGSGYAWSPDQLNFLYSRPDGIGIIDVRTGTQTKLLDINPYQTSADWAWIPGAYWAPDSMVIYAINLTTQISEGIESLEFNLVAIPRSGDIPIDIKKAVGMFAYPTPSPITKSYEYIDPVSGESLIQNNYFVAYLQADIPDESDTCQYSLYLVDRDGSNAQRLFPQENTPGLDPQHVVWSPVAMGDSGNYSIALIYNGNIWIIDSGTGVAQQITIDGLTERIDWR